MRRGLLSSAAESSDEALEPDRRHVAPRGHLAFACGESLPAGTTCMRDDTCQEGLACVDPADTFVASDDAGCRGATVEGITVCTALCGSDADCAAFDAVCASNGCRDGGICLRAGGDHASHR